MALMNLSLKEFIAELASSSPAPGGGTIAAVNGAFAAGLGIMACTLTLQRPNKTEASVLLPGVLDSLQKTRTRFIELAEEDTEAFNKVMRAYKLPKDSENAKEVRKKEIALATIKATQIPMETAQLPVFCCELLEKVLNVANDNLLSDCGVSIECANLAALGAIMNVTINLPGIKDEKVFLKFQNQLNSIKAETQTQYDKANEIFKGRFIY
jgi:formiminotetrahydrofolate cyclodeaminase